MHPWQVNSAPFGYDDESRRRILSGYYAATTAMDSGVGRILDWLEEHQIREDTLVIFMSDNGMNMGHHGIYGKGNGTFPQNMYDTSVKIPALISQPGRLPQGVVCDELLSQYDILPTLFDHLEISDPSVEGLPGTSFAPVFSGDELTGGEAVVVCNEPVVTDRGVWSEYGPVRMIRTREWKYVHRYPYGPHELYDLASDPGERVNLVQDPGHKAVTQELKAGLENWFVQYVDPMLDGTHEGVTGKGQIGLAGPAGEGENVWAGDWYYLRNRLDERLG
jgi:arylsulfatase A-like enzyme